MLSLIEVMLTWGKKQIGTKADANNSCIFNRAYGSPNAPWCVIFGGMVSR